MKHFMSFSHLGLQN
jgi:3',5'-cyclic AMP phosphodiesterase CpdA